MRHLPYRVCPVPVVLALLVGVSSGCLAGAGSDDSLYTGTVTLTEDFETGSKTSYAAANVPLATGAWNLNDALIGTSSSDVKAGSRAARIRNSGHITMGFDTSNGAGTVTIHHARFGSDGNGSWGLFASQDHGATFTQVGSTVATTKTSFATATFTVNLSGSVRFDIRKLDGGANHIDIDDVKIAGFDGGGGGAGASLSKHTTLGIPSPTSVNDPNSFLSVKSGYVVSYNSSRKVPNWVSWELNTSYSGSITRQDDFRSDNTLPANLPQASLADYLGSGFDRGHLCPSDDRTLTVAANEQTFYLTNMVPQAANNNRGPWVLLEQECRALASAGKEVYVIAGGEFSSSSKKVGSGVVVPDKTFKVVVVLDAVGQGPRDVTTNTRVIGVEMPNDDSQVSLTADWRNFRVSVDTIEAHTGYNFLSDVDPAIQAVIESRVDNQ